MRRLWISVLLVGCGAPAREPARPASPAIARSPQSPVSARGAGQIALEFARAQSGKPYCWGGDGPGCFDCSGLVSAAWSRAGLALPRTSDDMQRTLLRVPLLDAQVGDILWWPGHVGLYAGDGRVVDAGRSGGWVRERSLWGVPVVLRPQPI